MKTPFVIFLTFLVFGCDNLQKLNALEGICLDNGFNQKVEKVSFNKEEIIKLSGKFIQIEGVFRGNFEDVAVYKSRPSHSDDALWINFVFQGPLRDSLTQVFNDEKVVITGKVNIKRKGHFNAYLATLDSVFCIRKI